MSVITLDEKNKKRIQKFIKQEIGFYGYEQDIELLEENGQLTEALARKVFSKIMTNAQMTRKLLKPKENNEFKEQIEEAFAKYDTIPKPKQLEQYGFYDGSYKNMELDEVYSNMQIAFELTELNNKYYECKDLRDIANTVINSIDGIDKYQIKLQPEEKEELCNIQESLKELLSTDKTDMQSIQEKVNSYNEYATNIWNDYLTDINDTNDSEYRWCVHNLNKGELDGEFRDKYMSTSLITDKTMGRYGNSDYGLIIKPKHIVSASYRDTYTLNTRDDEENLFNIRPPLMLPQEIEEICIQQTINANGEMLNYEEARIYSELVTDEYEIEGVYYISNGEKELSRDYDRAKKVAEERGLPLIERDISKYRTQLGLEPMTERAQKNFCGNILRKCCAGDKELEKIHSKFSKVFINEHFQEFYEKYMHLKENSEFSKEDILKLFSEITRGDVHFDKISQNIDKEYLTPEEFEKVQMLQLEKEYGLIGITDRESLQNRLVKIVSEGIQYGTNKQNPESLRRFENIKKVMPQFEEFKTLYLQLREKCMEDKLYENIEFENVNYDELLEKATKILEEKSKTDEIQPDISDESVIVTGEEESIIQPSEETTTEVQEVAGGGARINEFGEIIRENNTGESVIQDSHIGADITQSTSTSKQLEQPQQIQEIQTTNMWKNRFQNWYSAIDRVSQNSKGKFLKMKADIVKAISDKFKERVSTKSIQQEQDDIQR